MKGISVNEGIAVGKALLLEKRTIEIEEYKVSNIEEEKIFYRKALTEAAAKIEAVMETIKKENGIDSEEYQLMEAHQMMILDDEMSDRTEALIEQEHISAGAAVNKVIDYYKAMFESMDSEYMRARAADCEDIRLRIIDAMNAGGDNQLQEANEIDGKYILVAEELFPSEVLSLNKKSILGIITEKGSLTSHVAILSRILGVPAIMGILDVEKKIHTGDEVLLNGITGECIISPTEQQKKEFKHLVDEQAKQDKILTELKGKPAISKNGRPIKLMANIGSPEDVEYAINNDAEGIGLFRTEFLFMDRNTMPDEEEQYLAYKKVSQAFPGKEVIIRTLDAGGDKNIEYLNIPHEENPFLGSRAIRVCLDRKDIFKTQLRALLRANEAGNISIMLPMICNEEELKKSKELLNEAAVELENEGNCHEHLHDIRLGIMIETPAAAIISDRLGENSDFFSIGTNDLTQYTLAVDRMNNGVAHIYDTKHPAVKELIKMTIENGHKCGIPVGVCGEAGRDPEMVEFLLDNGIDEISMSPASILKVKSVILGSKPL